MSDALRTYLQARNAERHRGWTPVPRYRGSRLLVVKLACGHSKAFQDDAPSRRCWRCHVCWELQDIDVIHKPTFRKPGPSRGRAW